MPSSLTDFAARGKVIRVEGRIILFAPVNSTYEISLACTGPLPEVSDRTVSGLIRAQARKIWTVPSGGNFLTPIFGPPRIVQGRVRYLDDRQMVVHGGLPVVVQLPPDNRAYDLINGPLELASLVNATLLPDATFELVPEPVPAI